MVPGRVFRGVLLASVGWWWWLGASAVVGADGLAGSLAGRHAAAELSQLLERADSEALHEHPVWLALLHYQRSAFSFAMRGRAETPGFYLAGDGDRDSRAELRATLRAFFDPAAIVKDDEHAQCAFVARRRWLELRLANGARVFPTVDCQYFERWRQGLDAGGLTLVFPEGFMNNPASMFGHTLLRVDAATEEGSSEILGYAVDFTADTQADSAPLYVAKGVLGFYPALFGVRPYYEQLKRYSDWENRDIWEYRLQVTEERLDFLLMHLWELRGIEFPYYFFTDNCSYELLRLLQIGVGDLHTLQRFHLFVAPLDTVKVVVDKPDFVGGVRYRASPETTLRAALQALTDEEQGLAEEVAEGCLDPDDASLDSLPPPRRAAVLDAAYDQLRYQYLARRVSEESSRNLSRRILIARSRIATAASSEDRGAREVEAPPVRPDQGHDSMRVSLAVGWRDDQSFLDLQFRPAYHSLLDDSRGYPEDMQIAVLDTRLRIYPQSGRLRLEELTLVDILSLSPWSRIFRPWAWSLRTGLRTRRVEKRGDFDDASVWGSQVGAGAAFDPFAGLLLYGLAEAKLDVGPDLESNVSFGPGARLGALLGPSDRPWKGHLFGDATRFVAGDTTTRLRGAAEARFSTSRNTALVMHGSANRSYGEVWFEASLRLDLHF